MRRISKRKGGFSKTSMKRMRQFYEKWSASIRPPMAVELPQVTIRPPTATDLEIVDHESLLHFRQTIAGDLNLEEFVSLSFSHHKEILNKTKTLDERLFYIHEAVIDEQRGCAVSVSGGRGI